VTIVGRRKSQNAPGASARRSAMGRRAPQWSSAVQRFPGVADETLEHLEVDIVEPLHLETAFPVVCGPRSVSSESIGSSPLWMP
jgi:hypothetical protein